MRKPFIFLTFALAIAGLVVGFYAGSTRVQAQTWGGIKCIYHPTHCGMDTPRPVDDAGDNKNAG